MCNYTIEKLSERLWGLFDSESETPDLPVVTCDDKALLEKVKQDFILCDKAEKNLKRIREA